MTRALPRLQKRILHKVTDLLLREIQDHRIGMITITRVELSRDRSHCRIHWSTLAEGGARSATAHGLDGARGFVQREVASILDTRLTPRIEFVFDPSVEGVERLSRLLREAQDEDRRRALARGDDPDAVPPGPTE